MKSLIVLLTAFTFGYFTTNPSITLQDAIESGMIEAKFIATGNYSGESINLKIKWLKGKKVPLTISHGTQFLSENEGDQDIFILEDQDFFVKSNEEETFPVMGYCCQANNSAPSENSIFKLSQTNAKDLLSLAKFCNGKRLDHHSKQAAIWAISDDHSLSDIYDIENPMVKSLRKKVAEIKQVEDNWYSTITAYEMDENRNISRQPIEVKGDLEYEFKSAGKLSYAVYDADDKLIKHLGEGLPITRPGSYSFGFNLKVEGWTPGKYSVKLSMNGNIIHAQAFEV